MPVNYSELQRILIGHAASSLQSVPLFFFLLYIMEVQRWSRKCEAYPVSALAAARRAPFLSGLVRLIEDFCEAEFNLKLRLRTAREILFEE